MTFVTYSGNVTSGCDLPGEGDLLGDLPGEGDLLDVGGVAGSEQGQFDGLGAGGVDVGVGGAHVHPAPAVGGQRGDPALHGAPLDL